MIEVELRAKITSAIKSNLLKLKGFYSKGELLHQSDLYIKHRADLNRDMVIRLRKIEGGDTFLTFKGKASNEDTAWPEYETIIDNADQLEQVLLSSGYEKVVLIDKTRESFVYNDMEVNLDSIKGLGDFIECEIIVESKNEVDVAKKEIFDFFMSVGVKNADIIKKGYVPLCIDAGIK